MAFGQFFLLPLPDSVAEDAARAVVYQANTNTPATIWADRARVFPYTSGIITIQSGQAYVSFYADELVDIEIQDSSYAPLQIFRGVAVINSEPAYDGDNADFNLAGLESRVLQGGFAANPTPISTVVAGVLNVIADYELHTISAEGEDIHTILGMSTPGRIVSLYFTGSCRLYNSTTGNLALERDYITTAGSLLTLQAAGGRFREVSRTDTNPDQAAPVVITINDEFVLPYNVDAFHVVSNASPSTDLNNVYLIDSAYDIPDGMKLYLRTYVGTIVYKNSGGNMRLEGDFTAPQGAMLALVSLGNLWHEVSRTQPGNNIQQQVSIPVAASQSITLTNTSRAVLLKSSGSAGTPAPDVWFMRGGQDGDEITLLVSPSSVVENGYSTYLTQRVPIASNAVTTNGYFSLISGKFGMVPGDCLKVIRLTDSAGKYYWQEVSRSMIDIEPLLKIDDVEQYDLEVWRPRHLVQNLTGNPPNGDKGHRINVLSPTWLPYGTILCLKAIGAEFRLTENSLDGASESPTSLSTTTPTRWSRAPRTATRTPTS